MTDDRDKTDEEILALVVGTFLGSRAKRPRAKPHRCFNPECRKVTKHVYCPACNAAAAKARAEG